MRDELRFGVKNEKRRRHCTSDTPLSPQVFSSGLNHSSLLLIVLKWAGRSSSLKGTVKYEMIKKYVKNTHGLFPSTSIPSEEWKTTEASPRYSREDDLFHRNRDVTMFMRGKSKNPKPRTSVWQDRVRIWFSLRVVRWLWKAIRSNSKHQYGKRRTTRRILWNLIFCKLGEE